MARGSIEEEARRLGLRVVSTEQLRDWGDRLWAAAEGKDDDAPQTLKELSSLFHAKAQ